MKRGGFGLPFFYVCSSKQLTKIFISLNTIEMTKKTFHLTRPTPARAETHSVPSVGRSK